MFCLFTIWLLRIDDYVKGVIEQHYQTIPHRNNRDPFKHWVFDFPEMLQYVLVKVKKLNSLTNTYDDIAVEGQIVSKYCDDIDRSTTYRVSLVNDENPLAKKKTVDISADKEYYQARFSYLDKYPDEKTKLDILHEKRKNTASEKENRLRLKEKKRGRVEEESKNVEEGNSDAVIEKVSDRIPKIDLKRKKNDKVYRTIEIGSLRKKALLKTTEFVRSMDFVVEEEEPIYIDNTSSGHIPLISSSVVNTVKQLNLEDIPLAFTSITSPTLNNNEQMDENILLVRTSDNLPSRVVSRTGRGIRSAYNDTYNCECGCEMSFEKIEMVYCSGGKRNVDNTNCKKLLNRRCCPNWICNDCNNLIHN